MSQHRTLYLVMELVQGLPLRMPRARQRPAWACAVLNRSPPPSICCTKTVIVHRDLKPQNVMVAEGRRRRRRSLADWDPLLLEEARGGGWCRRGPR